MLLKLGGVLGIVGGRGNHGDHCFFFFFYQIEKKMLDKHLFVSSSLAPSVLTMKAGGRLQRALTGCCFMAAAAGGQAGCRLAGGSDSRPAATQAAPPAENNRAALGRSQLRRIHQPTADVTFPRASASCGKKASQVEVCFFFLLPNVHARCNVSQRAVCRGRH